MLTIYQAKTGEFQIEFKPKWLVQSPSAPKNSLRCRQCAKISRINALKASKSEPVESAFCPLDLRHSKSPDYEVRISHAARLLFPRNPSDSTESHGFKISRFSNWLRSNTILPRLENLQRDLDRWGPQISDVDDKRFLVAMTLRDCTVFVKFFDDKMYEPEARLGDLDLKSTEKKCKWQRDENALIDEGWYTGTEAHTQPNDCLLNKQRRPLSI